MWFKWGLIALIALNALLTIAIIGEERKPVTKGNAAVSVILAALIIIGLLQYWQ